MKNVVYEVKFGSIYFDEETGTICGCDENVTEVNIPSKINGVDVTSIGMAAFRACNNLTYVTIPHSVTSISKTAFGLCFNLTDIIVDENNKIYSSIDGVLFNKSKEVLVYYPKAKGNVSYIIPYGVKSIGNRAFQGCCHLEDVTIPDSVISIGDYAFNDCIKLTHATLTNRVAYIGEAAFWFCKSLTDIAIPDSVTSIGKGAFGICESLTKITILNGVSSIGEYTFCHCKRLTGITIPKSVASIERYAFSEVNPEITIFCCDNSYAKQYAVENGIKYAFIQGKH